MPSISYSAGLPFTCRSCSGNIFHHWWCDWPHYNVCRSKCPVKDILNRKLNLSLILSLQIGFLTMAIGLTCCVHSAQKNAVV